ncbi:phage tail protein [Fusobacterium varium]
MLHLYNLEHVKIKGMKAYKDYCIESVLSTGDKTLSFLYPSHLAKDIIEECYIRNKTAEFVVKEIDSQGQWKSIKAVLNVEDLEGKEWEQFDSTEQTITDCLRLAIAGTGWTIGTCNVTRRRTVRKTNCSAWEVIQEAKKRYRVEIEFDTLNKKINIAEKLGADKGVYFMDSLNLKNLNVQSNSYDFYTRIIAKGKDDLKVIVENFQYSNKVKTLIWKDERYTDEASLREDATAKLEELSKPYRAYSADILDLANMSEKYKDILEYSLGDTITLISKEKGIREKQRVVTIREYPDEPSRNTCEIANTTLKFEDIQKEYQDTADIVDNITSDDGTISEDAVKGAFTVLNKVNANEINALKGQFGELKVNKLDVDVANIKFAEIDKAVINKADVTQLNAVSAKINVLEAESANINNILSGNIGSGSIQTIHLTGENVVFEDAVIKDLIAKKMTVSDMMAGNIDASKFNIVSSDGKLTIKDNTILIKDSTRTRVQIGKDASGDYSLYVWDKSGKLMFDALGIKSDAIKDKIIRDDMISDSANISGSKLNISSLITEVNKDTNTNLIKSSKVVVDLEGQTLDIAFNTLQTSVSGLNSITSNLQTQISANNGKITTLVKDTSIEKDGATIKLKDAYTSLEQTVNGINSTVVNNSSSISEINSSMSTVKSNITQLENKISLKVEQSDIDKTVTTTKNELVTKIDGIEIGGRNLVPNSSFDLGEGDWGVTNTTKEIKDGYDYHKACFIKRTGATNTSNRFYIYKTIKTVLEVGDTIILSGYIYVDSSVTLDSTSNALMLRTTQGDLEISILPDTPKDTWIYVSKTFTITEKRINPDLFFIFGKNGYAGVSMIKLEKGNKATDWTQAQEDVDQAIADVITTTDTKISNAKAEIKTTTDAIALNVSNLTTKTTTIDGKVTAQETRLQSAENKITPTSIVSSVNEALSGSTSSINTTSTTLSKNSFEVRNAAFKLYDTYGDLALASGQGWTYAQGGFQAAVAPHNKPVVRGVTLSSGNAGLKPYGITHESFNNFPFTIGSNTLKVEIRNMIDTEWANLEAKAIYGEGLYTNHAEGNYTQLIRNEVNSRNGDGILWLNYITDSVSSTQVVVGAGDMGNWGKISANSLYVKGSKNCIQDTEHYGYRAINAYETASYYFGDIGEGTIGEDGLCYISIDDVFMEVINTKCKYEVFLQKYGPGDLWIKERLESYFVIEGTPGLLFGWELKAKRKGFETDRLEIVELTPKVSMDFRLNKEDEETLNLDKRSDEALAIMSNAIKEENKEQQAILLSMDEEVRQEEMEREEILEEW